MRGCISLLLIAVFTLTSSALEAQTRRPLMHGRVLHLTATAYCGGGTTRSGIPAHEGVVAADPRVLPLRSVVRITWPHQTAGTYTVLDTGSEIKGRAVDIYMNNCSRARRFGRRAVQAVLLRRPFRASVRRPE
jgi:3D (Asp-Asp-Asp) domain-containing protein